MNYIEKGRSNMTYIEREDLPEKGISLLPLDDIIEPWIWIPVCTTITSHCVSRLAKPAHYPFAKTGT